MSIDPNNLQATATLRFSEEFDRFLSWDGSRGLNTTGGPQWNGRVTAVGTLPYNNELQWYVNANAAAPVSVRDDNPFSISDGALTITARRTATADRELFHGQAYTSGLVSTDRTFSQTYGYFEMRAQLPAGRGLWPAFWLLPIDGSWPPEIDVMEMLGDRPGVLHTTVHSQASGQERLGGTHFQTTASATVADLSAGFHTFGVDWEPDAITWYLDGQRVFSAPTPADLDRPMYMIANLAVGGDWPGSPDAATSFPAAMRIDYIRAYAARASAVGATAGNDDLTGTDGDDAVSLLAGDDTVRAGAGRDTVFGNDGADRLYGEEGDDGLYGNLGGDTLDGGQGDDTAFGGQNADLVFGGLGADILYGNLGADSLYGGQDADILFGGQGDDLLSGDAGNDTLSGDLGNDLMRGGAGADLFLFGPNSGADIVLDFDAAGGDRIALQGQRYTLAAGDDGSAQLTLSGGGRVLLAGVAVASLGPSCFA